jgi:hypothetical protein
MSFEQLEHTGQQLRASPAFMPRLVKLKERVAPSTYARELEVTRRYEQVRTQAKSTRTWEWLAEWERALRDAIELKLPDVQDTLPGTSYRLSKRSIHSSPKPGSTPSRQMPS